MDTHEGATEHIPIWSNWKTYISNLSKDVVGPHGVVRITAELVDGTTDPNRYCAPRCDFVVYSGDGGFWRLHPGSRSCLDATPKYFSPYTFQPEVLQSTEPVRWTAGELWDYQTLQLPFTRAHSINAPHVDRLGKKEVWAWICSLGAGEHGFHDFQLGAEEHSFRWWLWVATLDQSHSVCTSGITSARVQTDGGTWASFTFGRDGGSECRVELTPERSGRGVNIHVA